MELSELEKSLKNIGPDTKVTSDEIIVLTWLRETLQSGNWALYVQGYNKYCGAKCGDKK